MSHDATNPQVSESGDYVSFVAHIWVGENGKPIRGTIEDVHTGSRMALDLSELVAFLQASLIHSPQRVWDLQKEGEEDRNQEWPNERYGEGLSSTGGQDEHVQGT